MRILTVVLGLALAGWAAQPAFAQEVLAQRSCRAAYAGTTFQGVMVLERWMTTDSFRYYGQFQDPSGNVYELEVFTGDLSGGTGSTWANGMRHRETYMELRVFSDGFVVQTEDGVVVQFGCQ